MTAVTEKQVNSETPVSPRVLREHYLSYISFDSANKEFKPVCSCREQLEWHASEDQAVLVWVEHVQAKQRSELRLSANGQEVCGFCGVEQVQASLLVKGPEGKGGVCICSNCIVDAQGCADEWFEQRYREAGELEYDSW